MYLVTQLSLTYIHVIFSLVFIVLMNNTIEIDTINKSHYILNFMSFSALLDNLTLPYLFLLCYEHFLKLHIKVAL